MHGNAWYFMALHGIAWRCTVLYGTLANCRVVHLVILIYNIILTDTKRSTHVISCQNNPIIWEENCCQGQNFIFKSVYKKPEKLSSEKRKGLTDKYFKEEIQKFERLIDRDLSKWLV